LDKGFIAFANAAGSGFSLFIKDPGDSMTLHTLVSDTGSTHASAITAMAQMGDILLVGSADEYGISTYDTSTTTPMAIDNFGPDSGLGIMVPTVINTVMIDDQSFTIVASAGGSSGALSVFSLGPDSSF